MRVQIEKECENGFPSTINFIRHRKIHTIDAKCKLFTANSYTPISFHTAPEIPFMATPYNGVQIKRNILESGRSQGCPLKSLPGQTTIRLPDKVCQPGSGLPEQTSCSVLQSVFAALGSGSYKTRAAALPQQKHVPLWRVRRISRVLCV